MSTSETERNESIVGAFFDEVYNNLDLDRIKEFVAPGYVHYVAGNVVCRGAQETRDGWRDWIAGFSDMHTTVHDLFASGDKVVARATWQGLHTGEMWRNSPTNRLVTTTMILIFRLEDGRIAESWEEWDAEGFARQLAGE